MSVSYNRVIVAGNITRDVELRQTPSGTSVTDITIAVNRTFKDKEETTFVDVTLWAKTAEVAAEYVKKGDPLLVEGRLQLDKWENEDGEKRSKMKVIGERMQMLGTKGGGNGNGNAKKSPAKKNDEVPNDAADDGDIPF